METKTLILRYIGLEDEEPIGYVEDSVIYRLRWEEGIPVGRAERSSQGVHILRPIQYGERELGWVDTHGRIFSHGVLEGGPLGWVDATGQVVRSGLILGEEEIGRVKGPEIHAAAGALLLIFLPDEEERERRTRRP